MHDVPVATLLSCALLFHGCIKTRNGIFFLFHRQSTQILYKHTLGDNYLITDINIPEKIISVGTYHNVNFFWVYKHW